MGQYNQGYTDARSAQAVANVLDSRFGKKGDTVDKLHGWMNYAHELEGKLAAAEAALNLSRSETLAARIQRNTYGKHIDQLEAALRKVDPSHPLTNSVAVTASLRKEVDAELARYGFRIDRTNPKDHIIRKI